MLQHRMHPRSRRGTILILVLGLIALFMALMISITIRVYNAGKTVETIRRNAQAHIMLQAAKLYIAEYPILASPDWATTPSVTLGDTIPSGAFPAQTLAQNLGWVHITNTSGGAVSGTYLAIATGGASATVGVGKTALNSGSDIANAFDVRYLYELTFSAPNTFTSILLKPVGTYTW